MEQPLVKKEHGTELEYYKECMKTLAGAKEWAQMILDSKMCPKHFYETKKNPDGKIVTDYTTGNVGALLMVIQQGKDVEMKGSQALQQIVPINGLMSIKGDGGKALIFRSGKVKEGSWIEKEEGDINSGNFKVTITATRSDNGETLTRAFSVDQAKRAGLWITNDKLQGKDGWRFKLSPWYKYPDRMIKYRALGFLERDLFPDVLSGMVTSEEAEDYPEGEVVTTVTTADGKKIQVTPQLGERSAEVTDDTVRKIDKGKVEPEKKIKPEGEKPLDDSVKTDLVKKYGTKEEDLLTMGPKIYPLAESFTYNLQNLAFWIDKIPGKKSNKKYRLAIMAFQDGIFDKYLEREIDPKTLKELGKPPITSPEETQGKVNVDDIDETLKETPGKVKESAEKESTKKESPETTEFDKQFAEGGGGGEPDPNETANATNKQGIEIPDLPAEADAGGKKERPFDQVKFVYDELSKVGVDNNAWIARTKGHPFGQLYKDREDFCRRAKKIEINELLNSL